MNGSKGRTYGASYGFRILFMLPKYRAYGTLNHKKIGNSENQLKTWEIRYPVAPEIGNLSGNIYMRLIDCKDSEMQ